MDEKEKTLKYLEKEAQKPDFWKDAKSAAETSQEITSLKEDLEKFEELKKNLEELKEAAEMAAGDENLQKDIDEKIGNLENKINKEEFRAYLSGKYDRGNAIMQIAAGVGGLDSQDWATLLLRMYQRYCAKKGFVVKILHQAFGQALGPEGRIGTKSVILEIKGNWAYGFLKKETGAHRLVRISPFSGQQLRHTSFALVEVLPEIPKVEIEAISPEDLKIETFRASGPGGQNVNRRETAVRVIHLPTGISVSSQAERSQLQNREEAMKVLYAKLFQLKEEMRLKEIKELKGKPIIPSWGNQIRSYVLHPYKLVKDLRTGAETSDAEKVLDGDLDLFIDAEIKINPASPKK